MSKPLTPLVDFARTFLLTQFDTTAGAYVPVTGGTAPTCYLATSDSSLAEAHASLTGAATYIGGNGDQPAGTWFFGIDAAVLTFALLDGLFYVGGVASAPYFIVLRPSGVRVAEKLNYVRVKKVVAA